MSRRGLYGRRNAIPGRGEAFRYPTEDTRRSLNEYIDLIHEYVQHGIGDPIVLVAARRITSPCDPYDQECEVLKIFEFVRKYCRYAPAPSLYGVDGLQTAAMMVEDIRDYGRCSGECEEIGTLLAALLANMNLEVALVYGGEIDLDEMGFEFPNYRHVWVAVYLPKRGWIHLEPTAYDLEPGQHFQFSEYGWDFIGPV